MGLSSVQVLVAHGSEKTMHSAICLVIIKIQDFNGWKQTVIMKY